MGLHGNLRRHRVVATACLSVLFLAIGAPATAQEPGWADDFILVAPENAGKIEPWDIRAAEQRMRSQFRLFAEGDRAWTSLRLVGDNHQFLANTGPGDDRNLWAGTPNGNTLTQFSTSLGTRAQAFGNGFFVGVPRSEWVQYLVEGVESLRNVTGEPPGYTVNWNAAIFARPKDWNAADGLVGKILSGLISTTDGTCRDHSQGLGGTNMPAGFQLLPGSNCAETFSPGGDVPLRGPSPAGWLGDRPISPDSWLEHFTSLGSSFRWNRWQVPASLKDQSKFLGNNFSTYGHFNDYNSSSLRKYGNVVPGGSGDPTRDGYPLGLDFQFDAFTFTLPTLANAQFWGGLIINNSEKLYGVAHDYDSVYVGIGPWPQRSQDGDSYSDVVRGVFIHRESEAFGDPRCALVDPIPLIGNTCDGFGGASGAFAQGAAGIMVLKSPIGDMRNKLFTTAGSPFFLPSHPLAGDTITFNHSLNWNFGTQTFAFAQASQRGRFGILSSIAQNTLDGTACADFSTVGDRWSTFMSNEWPDGEQCKKGHFVPGDWSYVSNRPLGAPVGEPDTLFLHGCGPPGCPPVYGNATWQNWSINRAGNLSQFSIGPFRLEAGDTTELLIAIYSGRDSVSFEGFTDGILDFYLGLFAGPEPAPTVFISAVDVGAGLTVGGADTADVTLVWDDAAENFEDPFLAKFADDMEAAAPGTELALIRDNNSTPFQATDLVDRIRDRARDNLKRLLLFRSCDAGSTFDSDGDCVGDPATDEAGNAIEPGWQAFAEFGPDANGDFPNTFTDALVTPGITYLYSLIGESEGFEEIVITDPNAIIDGLGNFTCGALPCETNTLTVAPPLLNPLARSAAEPNVISVYVPTSVAAGGSAAAANLIEDTSVVFGQTVITADPSGRSTVPFDVLLSSDTTRESTFRVQFGNFFRVVEFRDAATEELDSVSVTVQDLARTVVGATGTTTQDIALSSQTFTRTDGVPVTLSGFGPVVEATVGAVLTRTFELGPTDLDPDNRTASGFVLVEEDAVAGTLPLLTSGTLTGNAATPGGFLSNPAFPGFLVSADNSDAGDFDTEFDTDAAGDTVATQLDPTLNFDQTETENLGVQSLTFGEYIVEYSDSVFGPSAPFTLDFENPSNTDDVFDASLRTRTRGTPSVTDPEAVTLVADALGADPADVELAAVTLPFTLRNLNHGREAEFAVLSRPAAAALTAIGESRTDSLKVLGVAPDTLSVTVDADQWIPEDRIFVIETIDLFRTRDVGGDEAIVVDAAGTPERETRRVVTLGPLNLTCGGANASCNPVSGAGFVGATWIGARPGDVLHFTYFSPFSNSSVFTFSPTRALSGEDIIAAGSSIEAQMDSIRVVPNPYIFFSQYETQGTDRRIMFTHLPPDGEIRIYTVAGNFVQEIDWSPADLAGNGDLFWDLQTREGNLVGGGLYIFVVQATDPATQSVIKKLGKLVIIR